MNQNLLKARMLEQGITPDELASKLGLNTATFYRKLNGTSDFYRTEMLKMKSILSLSNTDMRAIFLEEDVA